MTYLKFILYGVLPTICSLVIYLFVSSKGVVIIDNLEFSPELSEMRETLLVEDIDEFNERYLREAEAAALIYREENPSYPQNIYAYKASSWYLTWVPWLLFGFFMKKSNIKEQACIFVIPIVLAAFQFWWWREIAIFMLVFYLGCYLRKVMAPMKSINNMEHPL